MQTAVSLFKGYLAFNGWYYITIFWPNTWQAIIHNSTSFINVLPPMAWLVLLWHHLQLPPGPSTQPLLRQPKRTAHGFKISSRSLQMSALVVKCTFARKQFCDARRQNVTHCVNALLFLLCSIAWSFDPTHCAELCVENDGARNNINPNSISDSSTYFPLQNKLTFCAKSLPTMQLGPRLQLILQTLCQTRRRWKCEATMWTTHGD